MTAPDTCELCGRPVLGAEARYCCPGCAAISEIVTNLAVPDAEKDTRVKAMLSALFDEPAPPPASAGREDVTLDLMVAGMVCPACAWIIHHCVSKLPGVRAVTINFISETCQVVFDPMMIGRDRIETEISRMGYAVHQGEASGGLSLLQLGLGWFYALNAMMLSFIVYSAEFWQVPPAMAVICACLLVIFTVLVIAGPGRATLSRGLQQLRHRQFRMDSLITLSTMTAMFYSFYSLTQGSLAHLYFDVVCLLVMLLETGSAIEGGFYDKVRRRVHALRQGLPKKVRTPGADYIPLENLVPGLAFVVRKGEAVPTDGLLEQPAAFDFSHVTGESRAIHLEAGQLAGAGSRLLDAEVSLRVPPGGATSLIDRMIEGTVSAFDTRVEQLSLGDRISQVFVPVIVLLGFLPLAWFAAHGDLETGVLRLMAVLVVSCPCAFGIAEPLVLTMAVDRIRALGIQIFNGSVLRLQPDVVIFDKTGTLTTGSFTVKALHWQIPENQETLDVMASLESGLDHPIARALSRLGTVRCLEAREVMGTTVQGRDGGRTFQCGKLSLYEGLDDYAEHKTTLVACGDDARCHVVIELSDEIRPEVPALLPRLPEAHLCSGDRQPIVEAVARELGIRHCRWDMSIEDKLTYIREQQGGGRTVMMVGDGVNDAQALAAADLGLAVLGGELPAKFSADGSFLVSDLSGLSSLLQALRDIRRRIRQNYGWSFLYNGIGLTLALTGWLSPTFCAFGMVFSNSVVIINSVRRLKTAA